MEGFPCGLLLLVGGEKDVVVTQPVEIDRTPSSETVCKLSP